MRNSMDWTFKGNTVDGLFFCATLTGRRRGHTPFVQAGVETSDTGAEAVKPRCSRKNIPGGWVPGMKVRSLVLMSNHSAFHQWSVQCAALLMMLSDKLMSSCAAGTNACLHLRCRAFPLDGRQVSAKWSRCPGAMAWRAGDSMAPLRQSSTSRCHRKVVRWCRTQTSSHRSQGVVDGTVNEADMSTAAPDRSAILCWLVGQGLACNVVPPAPQLEPASRLKSATRNVSFLRSDSRCRRYVSDLSNVTPRYLGSEKGRVSLLWLTFTSSLASLLLRRKTTDTVFVVLSFSFQIWRYSPAVAMSFPSASSPACQLPSAKFR